MGVKQLSDTAQETIEQFLSDLDYVEIISIMWVVFP